MTEGVIECYDAFNRRLFPNELLFGYFHNQPIPLVYYDLLNDDYEKYIPSTPVDSVFTDNKRVEYSVMPNTPGNDANDEDITNEIIIDDADSLTLVIDPL